jgi:hypothetical protein
LPEQLIDPLFSRQVVAEVVPMIGLVAIVAAPAM